MIPLRFRLREEVRLEQRGDSWIVVVEVPLNVVRVSDRAARMLRLCDGKKTVREMADETGIPGEEEVFRLCDYFNKRGILEIGPAGESVDFPRVTVIIPVRDRAGEIADCLKSVLSLDYPKDKVEVIVIDDGSVDGTADVVRTFPCRLLRNRESRGQSYCRNRGAEEATGDILAFIDSDCVAGRMWLKELVPYFQWERVGAVGGFVDGYFEETTLDRYEKVSSPLNVGRHILYGGGDRSTFYVPTCNLLARRDVYREVGGITESLHVGEDVDFCWRMRNRGHDLLYVPRGVVQHRHRASLRQMLRRRADYGTSEALLYALHEERKKTLQLPPLAATAFVALIAALLSFSLWPLFVAAGAFLVEAILKMVKIGRMKVRVGSGKVLFSTVRADFSFFYFISFHLVRYYLSLFVVGGVLFHPLWCLGFLMLVLTSAVDYTLRRPGLTFPLFLFYYGCEHISYQLGVFAGCVKQRTFGSYAPRFIRKMAGSL